MSFLKPRFDILDPVLAASRLRHKSLAIDESFWHAGRAQACRIKYRGARACLRRGSCSVTQAEPEPDSRAGSPPAVTRSGHPRRTASIAGSVSKQALPAQRPITSRHAAVMADRQSQREPNGRFSVQRRHALRHHAGAQAAWQRSVALPVLLCLLSAASVTCSTQRGSFVRSGDAQPQANVSYTASSHQHPQWLTSWTTQPGRGAGHEDGQQETASARRLLLAPDAQTEQQAAQQALNRCLDTRIRMLRAVINSTECRCGASSPSSAGACRRDTCLLSNQNVSPGVLLVIPLDAVSLTTHASGCAGLSRMRRIISCRSSANLGRASTRTRCSSCRSTSTSRRPTQTCSTSCTWTTLTGAPPTAACMMSYVAVEPSLGSPRSVLDAACHTDTQCCCPIDSNVNRVHLCISK